MQRSKIKWTDFTSNPIRFRNAAGDVVWGCVHASPGCQHCYAEAFAQRLGKGGPFNVPTMAGLTPFLDEKELRAMLTHKPAMGQRIFVGDMTDIFGEWVSDAVLDRLFGAMALAGRKTWQLLTKRADRLRVYLNAPDRRARILSQALDLAGAIDGRPEGGLLQEAFLLEEFWKKGHYWPLPNVWLGVSAEDQQRANERIAQLLETPAAVRFISAEPLLGPINLHKVLCAKVRADVSAPTDVWGAECSPRGDLHWVIVGGESGPGARGCDVDAIRSIVEQCRDASVPVFIKQLGAGPYSSRAIHAFPKQPLIVGEPTEAQLQTMGRMLDAAAIYQRDRKGGDPSEWPEDLRIRQFPEARG
jgi:protein gp37